MFGNFCIGTVQSTGKLNVGEGRILNVFVQGNDKLEGKLEKKANCVNELEGQIALQKKMSDLLEIKCDNNEQYSRRTSI